ncbi:mucin-17 [Phyllostomus hastatus]|uniref:mucin-17 n=1 Tax=Phyllostomus hastatus TaxID=9423 RepID=UPI001E6820A7|nr:mucin-17 [Phyllostomus hastatus]
MTQVALPNTYTTAVTGKYTSVTIVPTSPTTLCIEIDPNSKVTFTPTIPLPVFTSTAETATTPSSSTSMTAVFPTHTDTSTSDLETDPTNIITDVPNSLSPGTIPISTVSMRTRRPTSGTWMSSYSVTTPPVSSFTRLPLTMRQSSSFPTVMMMLSKSTHPSTTTTRTPEISVVTTQTPTTFTSPRTTLTTTQMTTSSRLTTTPGTCDSGGTWMQGHCLCHLGFSGDHYELQEIRCQNGGQCDGLKCHSHSTFHGSQCEFAVEQVELKMVDAEVSMEVSVQQTFTPCLSDNTSEAYMDFSNTFKNQMKNVYRNMQGFKDVEILSLRNGSIVVDYLVLLELPFSVQLENEYEKVKTALKEELQNASKNSCPNNQTLCFKHDSIKVNNNTTELTPEAICRRTAAQGYENFYFPLVEENRLRCITKCRSGVDGAINCNQGQCFLEKSRCFATNTYWFLGSRCEVTVSWKALVGGLAGATVLLLLLLLLLMMMMAAFGVFMVGPRRRRGQEQCTQKSAKDYAYIYYVDEMNGKPA